VTAVVLSKREKFVLLVSGAVIGVAALYVYVIEPLITSRDKLETQRLALQREVDDGRKLIARSRQDDKRWPTLRAAGLLGDASASGSQLLNELQASSQASGLPLISARPDRAASIQGLQDFTLQATADGSMRAMVSFLYRLETTQIPARIRELQIASRVEAADDLSMQLRISTLWEERKQPAAGSLASAPVNEKEQP